MRGVDDELPGMIDQDVERLEDDRDPLGLDDLGAGLEGGDDRLGLLVPGITLGLLAGDDAELLDAQLLGHGDGRPDLFLELLPPRRIGVGDPVAEALDGEAENWAGGQAELLVQLEDRVDVLVAPRPELVVREAGLLDLPEPFQEGQLRPGHLDIDGVGQPGTSPEGPGIVRWPRRVARRTSRMTAVAAPARRAARPETRGGSWCGVSLVAARRQSEITTGSPVVTVSQSERALSLEHGNTTVPDQVIIEVEQPGIRLLSEQTYPYARIARCGSPGTATRRS